MGQDPIEVEVLSPEEAAQLEQSETDIAASLAELSLPVRWALYALAMVTALGILFAGVVHVLRSEDSDSN